jgi:ribosomal protein L11 methyltransferase
LDWKEIKVYTTTIGVDTLSGHLITLGVNGVVVEDKEDFNEFLTDKAIYWDYVDDELMSLATAKTCVKFYLPNNDQGKDVLAKFLGSIETLKANNPLIDLGTLEIEFSEVYEEDWETAWKKYYHPLRIGNNIVVCPSWEECEINGDDIKLSLDPGMAFGTGSHSSTKLCIELLEKTIKKGDSVLDVGCGSGILSITSLLLGAKNAVGVDIDELATKVAIDNARLNDVDDKLTVYCGDLTSMVSGKFDVVCANIVADIIIRLCDDVVGFIKDKGTFITSGIIDERKDEVVCAIKNAGLSIEEIKEEKGWVAIKAKKC